jgi:prolyl-tRNA synthetase
VVIVPIYKGPEQLSGISETAEKIKKSLEEKGISVKYDDRDTHKPGWKFAEYELKGVPVRLAIGPRDVENGTAELARRDTLEKSVMPQEGIAEHIEKLLEEIQENIYNKALRFRADNTCEVDTWEEFLEVINTKGGFVSAHWDGTAATEEKIKELTKATIRLIPVDTSAEQGQCVYSGNPSERRVIFAKAY